MFKLAVTRASEFQGRASVVNFSFGAIGQDTISQTVMDVFYSPSNLLFMGYGAPAVLEAAAELEPELGDPVSSL